MTPTAGTSPTDNHAAAVLAGLVTRKQLAEEWRCSEMTIIRRERAGLPVIRLGMTRLYDPAKVRAWVLDHEHRQSAPKRGRPAKKAA